MASNSTDWRTPFRSVRQQFEAAAERYPDCRTAVVKCPDRRSLEALWRRLGQEANAAPGVPHKYAGAGKAWRVVGTEEQELSILTGPAESVRQFQVIGRVAGAGLPLELRPTHPFHPFSGQPESSPPGGDHLGDWIAFLFTQICDSTLRAAIEYETDWPSAESRIARLTIDPFHASVHVIDLAILGAVPQGKQETNRLADVLKVLKQTESELTQEALDLGGRGYEPSDPSNDTLVRRAKKRYLNLARPCYEIVRYLWDMGHLAVLAEHAKLTSAPIGHKFPYVVPPLPDPLPQTVGWHLHKAVGTSHEVACARLLLWLAVAYEPSAFGHDWLFPS